MACLTNGDTTDQTGQFVLGISADVSGGQTYSVSGDVTLITFGFIAVAPTTGSSIKLIPGHGACEILMDLVEVPVPCLDGGAVITATR
ncbi:MAG: hypothetical protein DMF50_11150 [Acidobacteria bacterium]|nr:MAG: hypothetical protein DMF50_11150 [Acidobacteriota bacterium]